MNEDRIKPVRNTSSHGNEPIAAWGIACVDDNHREDAGLQDPSEKFPVTGRTFIILDEVVEVIRPVRGGRQVRIHAECGLALNRD
jgi:hypothetical protein